MQIRRGGTQTATIERTIRFFVLRCEKKSADGNYADVNPVDVLHGVNALDFSHPDGGRYAVRDDGSAVGLLVEDSEGGTLRGTYFRVRRNDLPSIERAGRLRPLDILADEGLFEPCHYTLFDQCILGYESSFDGPRAGSIAYYLMEKVPTLVDRARLEPIFRTDWEARLQQIGDVRLARISIARDQAEQAGMLRASLGQTLKAQAAEIQLPFNDGWGNPIAWTTVYRQLRQIERRMSRE